MDLIAQAVAASGIDVRAVGNDLLLGYGAGTAIGTFVAYRQRQRDPEADAFTTVTRWSAVGVATVAAVIVLKVG